MVPTLASERSAVTLNLRVLSCISLAKATLFDPVRKTVTSDVKPLIKYLITVILNINWDIRTVFV